MIPIRDDIPSRSFPIVNVMLIVLNVLAFLYELALGPQLEKFFQVFAVVPIRYYYNEFFGLTEIALVIPLFTSMFLHGGWAHILGNMLYLWIFGDNVEDRMGHFRFLVFYLLCGLAASAAHIWSVADNPEAARMPSLGASGAIAGVLGAYMLLYPGARVVTLLPLGFFITFVEIPSLFFLGLWFLQQFIVGTLSLSAQTAQTGGVAWWAHIGGFASGMALVWFFRREQYRPRHRDVWWEDRYR